MMPRTTRNRLVALAVAAALVLSGHALLAQECNNCGKSRCCSHHRAAPNAALYPSPRPTPPQVGHTYITYPPFAPQHYLYTHHQHYIHRDPCVGGLTCTSVSWGHRLNLFHGWNETAPFFNLDEARPR